MTFISLNNVGPQVWETQVPIEARRSLDQSLLEREQRLFENAQRIEQGLAGLHKEYKHQIRQLIGEDIYRENLERWHGLLNRFVNLSERKTITPDSDRKISELRRELAAEKHAFYHGLGFEIQEALHLRESKRERSSLLLAEALQRDENMPSEDDAPEPTPTDNPWTWRFPPYANQWTKVVASYGTTGKIMKSTSANSQTGEIKLDSWIELVGADDSDYLKTDLMSEVGFWYQMPAAGVLEVWAWYQDINTDYTGYLADESGCSDASVHQLSRQYLWTGGSTERYIIVVDKKYGEDDEGSFAEYLSLPGSIVARHFFSNKAYATNEWVYAAIGVQDYNYFWVDDMSCRSRMKSQYFVKQVAVRSTGAP